jgi:hypothetical protein
VAVNEGKRVSQTQTRSSSSYNDDRSGLVSVKAAPILLAPEGVTTVFADAHGLRNRLNAVIDAVIELQAPDRSDGEKRSGAIFVLHALSRHSFVDSSSVLKSSSASWQKLNDRRVYPGRGQYRRGVIFKVRLGTSRE